MIRSISTRHHDNAKATKRLRDRHSRFLRVLRVPVKARRWFVAASTITWVVALDGARLQAHSGPPFPILSDHVAGAYQISIWTDPDATDDRSAGGKFWVMLQSAVQTSAGRSVPAATRVNVVIKPLDRDGGEVSARAEPVNGEAGRQFAALLMDHEGPFGVHVTVEGPLGRADVQASADATYDLRPRPILIALFVLPFVLVGFVWGKLLIRRRMLRPGGR
jgi:hypothetical protein